jgi:hypothetical protein
VGSVGLLLLGLGFIDVGYKSGIGPLTVLVGGTLCAAAALVLVGQVRDTPATLQLHSSYTPTTLQLHSSSTTSRMVPHV